VNHFPDKPLISTPMAIVLILLLLAVKWTFWPDDEFYPVGEDPPALRVELDDVTLEAALSAANQSPVRPATLVLVPCAPAPARPILVGRTQVALGAAIDVSRPSLCFIEIDLE
jgi:hypothetical protein